MRSVMLAFTSKRCLPSACLYGTFVSKQWRAFSEGLCKQRSRGVSEAAYVIGEEQRQQVQQCADEMKLFAYPRHRGIPWATFGIFAASGLVTLATAAHWRLRVASTSSVEELRPRVENFTNFAGACTVRRSDVERGQFHHLILASLQRAGDEPLKLAADGVVLGCCGALLERLYGPAVVLSAVFGGTVVTGICATIMHDGYVKAVEKDTIEQFDRLEPPRIFSAHGGITALGTFCALHFGRWAAVPGVPLPLAWVMAPLFVSTLSAASAYGSNLREYREALLGWSENAKNEGAMISANADLPPTLSVAIGLAACEAARDSARKSCQPPLNDIAEWHIELQDISDRLPPQAPDGGFLADVIGAVAAALAAVISARRATFM